MPERFPEGAKVAHLIEALSKLNPAARVVVPGSVPYYYSEHTYGANDGAVVDVVDLEDAVHLIVDDL